MTPERRTRSRALIVAVALIAAVAAVAVVPDPISVAGGLLIVAVAAGGIAGEEDESGSTRGGRGDGTPAARHRRTADGRDRASLRLRTHWSTAALIDRLLDQAARQLPLEADRDRWAEEWDDHRRHLRCLRLLWWAWWVRATASRTAAELRHARLPSPDR